MQRLLQVVASTPHPCCGFTRIEPKGELSPLFLRPPQRSLHSLISLPSQHHLQRCRTPRVGRPKALARNLAPLLVLPLVHRRRARVSAQGSGLQGRRLAFALLRRCGRRRAHEGLLCWVPRRPSKSRQGEGRTNDHSSSPGSSSFTSDVQFAPSRRLNGRAASQGADAPIGGLKETSAPRNTTIR